MIIYLNYKISGFYQKFAEAEIMVRDNNDRDKYGPFSKKDQITAVIKNLTKVIINTSRCPAVGAQLLL